MRFGPTAGNVTASNATSITVTVPASGVAGPVPIVVQNSNGTTAVSNSPFTYTVGLPTQAPSIQPLTPDRGPVTGGTAITITGTQFAPGATTVTVGGVAATDVQVLSNTQIVAVTPAGAEGPQPVVVTVYGTASGGQNFIYEPLAAPILTCNLTSNDGDSDGVADTWETQFGFSPLDNTDGALDSDGDGRTNAQECTALTHPRGLYTRFLAEGATGSFFDTRVVLANPGATPARVLLRFQTGLAQVVRHFLVIPATSRRTIDLRLLAGLESANISSVIESDVQVVVDRTMRWDQTSRSGAHAETSSPAPSLTWYLAEGATHGAFDLFYLIQNPSQTQAAQVRIRYLLPAGAPIEQDVTVPPNTRATVYVDRQPGLAATDVSGVLQSLNGVPIIVERAMYSSAAGTFAAGHDSAGVTSPSLEWFFAEGATGSFFDTFMLMANPNAVGRQRHRHVPAAVGRHRQPQLRAAAEQPHDDQRAGAERPARLDRGVGAAGVDQRRLVPGRALDVVAARPAVDRGAQRCRCDDDRHQVGGRRRRGRRAAGRHRHVPPAANTAGVAASVRVTLLFETGRRGQPGLHGSRQRPVQRAGRDLGSAASADLHAGAARDAVQRGGREPRRDADRRRAGDVLERQRPAVGRGLGSAGDQTSVIGGGRA